MKLLARIFLSRKFSLIDTFASSGENRPGVSNICYK